ncbi:MAG: ISL3 family transposase [Gammaproteobacteria bacterium]|nr:ISL3 family transposase [Gammaproteobacteria bacterium]MYB77824.1 ISL3 family transposase [Chloroflexota bacterium]
MVVDPTLMCELLVGLGVVDVVGVEERSNGSLWVTVRTRSERPVCDVCGGRVWSKGDRPVGLVDLPVFGRPVRLWWRKRRWMCADPSCGVGSFVEQDLSVAPQRALLTSRAGRWATWQVGRLGRTVAEVAEELGCDWHTVNREVIRWGDALLEADIDRFGAVEAVGVDETLFWREGKWKTKQWCTSVVDVRSRQLLDIVPGRTAESAASWFRDQSTEWCKAIRWAVLDMSGPYQVAYDKVLPHADQVADPFHVVRLANHSVDLVRRRVQNETLGHRGRKSDPLYRIRRLLVMAHERVDDRGKNRIQGLLRAGDPYGEVRDAWYAKESVRDIYQIGDPKLAAEFTQQLSGDLQDRSLPPETQRLGRTIARWATQITNWHLSAVTNGPTEGLNNLIKRIKRAAFGFRNFANYRIRALLYAGKPNWQLLATITPP